MPIKPQLHLAVIQALLVTQLLLQLVVDLVVLALYLMALQVMEHLVALVAVGALMQALHRGVLELLDKVILAAQLLAQILVNMAAAAVLALLELMVSIPGITVEMVGLD
jgi:hypothetical protein